MAVNSGTWPVSARQLFNLSQPVQPGPFRPCSALHGPMGGSDRHCDPVVVNGRDDRAVIWRIILFYRLRVRKSSNDGHIRASDTRSMATFVYLPAAAGC